MHLVSQGDEQTWCVPASLCMWLWHYDEREVPLDEVATAIGTGTWGARRSVSSKQGWRCWCPTS